MEAQLKTACAALKVNRTEVMKKKKKGNLFSNPTTVQLVVQFADNQELPDVIQTHKVVLPAPMFSLESTDACLITRPPQRKVKDTLRTASFPHRIERVIDIRKLKRKFKSYAEREKLHKSYTLFLADKHITDQLPELLGRDFMFKAKMPVPVSVPYKSEELKDSLAPGFSTAMFHVAKKSEETTVGIGNTDQDEAALAKNGKAVIEYLKTVPAFANNIRAIRVKTQHSPALLVYQNQNVASKDASEATNGKKRKREAKTEEQKPAEQEEDAQTPPTRKQKGENGKAVAATPPQKASNNTTPQQTKTTAQQGTTKPQVAAKAAVAAKKDDTTTKAQPSAAPKVSPKATKEAPAAPAKAAATPAAPATPATPATPPTKGKAASSPAASAPKASGKAAAKGKQQQQPAARSASGGSVGSPKPAGKAAWK